MVSIFFLSVWPSRWRRSRKEKQQQQRRRAATTGTTPAAHEIPATPKDIPEVTMQDTGASTKAPPPSGARNTRNPRRRQSFDTFEYSLRRNSSSFRIFKHESINVPMSDNDKYSLEYSETELDQTTTTSSNNTSLCLPPHTQFSTYLGWGNCYTFQELELATNGFSEQSIIGEGGYGVVYRGALVDGTMVACKYLTNKGQAEREFLVEVETIGRVRHKNLVKLLGFCAEGDHRVLVYEYVDNGNLEEWLHGPTSRVKTPNWEARMKVILGTAKGLAYLHEALEPKIVHRDIKASNILLDSRWNAKVSDFGLAKSIGSEKTHVMTRVMGTFGYVAPEYANTGLLNERSDVYSFGVLLMEIVTGRDPVDYSRAPGEVNLVDWLKLMLATKRMDDVADPRLEEKPSPRALKKALITALQCVHPDVYKRPTMGHVVHLLEAESFQLPDNWKAVKEVGISKLIESQNQKRLVQSLSKDLQTYSHDNSLRSRRMRYAA